MRHLGLTCLLSLALVAPASAEREAVRVATYPSTTTIRAQGLPAGGSSAITLNSASDERESAWIVVTGAKTVAAAVERPFPRGIHATVRFAHYVDFGGRLVPDALLPWDGSPRASEQANQPIYLSVDAPPGVSAAKYEATVTVTADGRRTRIPVHLRVFPLAVPDRTKAAGNPFTSFHVNPGSYVNKAVELYGLRSQAQRREANRALFSFLGRYRIAPARWGFGEPLTSAGYAQSRKWWQSTADNMLDEMRAGAFASLWVPLSNNRFVRPVAGLAYNQPEAWCDYLRTVRSFWAAHGWLGGTVQYIWGYDEPGPEGKALVARQGKAVHGCFPGGRTMMTGNPTSRNGVLWDGKGGDDLDIWVVLKNRWYGRFTVPNEQKIHSRARDNLGWIDGVRRRGALVASFLYGTAGPPGFRASEPLANPRMYLLWNALEGTDGIVYSQGTTNYPAGNPLTAVGSDGEFILLYPGPNEPIASARLEQIRDGLEDWTLFERLRRLRGSGAVRAVLGDAGVFSATAKRVQLGCTVGCDFLASHPYSWPRWSQGAATPRRIEAARLAALRLSTS